MVFTNIPWDVIKPGFNFLIIPHHTSRGTPEMSNKAQVDAIEVTPQEKGVTLQDDRLAGLKGDLQAHQYKSKLDNLSTWESIKVFRKTVLICSLAGFTACLDGECPCTSLFVAVWRTAH